MILSKYSTIEMYNNWKSGIPISEIVKEGGISRKTLNKRFERIEKKITATFPNSDLINKNNVNSGIKNNDDNGDKSVNNNANVAKGKGDSYKFWGIMTLVILITFIVVLYWPQISEMIMNDLEKSRKMEKKTLN